jgi:hypothetical protein
MFRDLKEYQEIQNLYESQVYLSEEEENELFDIVESFDLTDEELEYFVENLEEFSADQDLQEIKNIKRTFQTLNRLKGGQFGGGMKTGIDLTKSAKRANLKNLMGRKPFDPIKGPKFAGPVNLGKFTSIKDKLKTNAKRLAIAGGGVGTIAIARQLGKGSDVEKQKEKKKIENKVKEKTITKVTPTTTGGGSTDAEGKKIPSTKEIRAKSDRATSAGNAGSSTDSGGTAGPQKTETKTDTKPKTTETKTQTSTTTTTPQKKMSSIEKKNRARFGDERVDMLKAKNKDFQAMKKGSMTKDEFIKKYPKSITAQRSKGLRDHTEWDAYDLVLEYLMSTGQVDTIEEANYVMMQLDKENIQEIAGIRTAMKVAKAVGKFGAKSPTNFAATLGGAGVVGQTVVKPVAQTLGKMTAPKVETPKVQTSTNDVQVGSGIDARQPGESLLDYAKRRKKSLETQDRKLGAGEY